MCHVMLALVFCGTPLQTAAVPTHPNHYDLATVGQSLYLEYRLSAPTTWVLKRLHNAAALAKLKKHHFVGNLKDLLEHGEEQNYSRAAVLEQLVHVLDPLNEKPFFTRIVDGACNTAYSLYNTLFRTNKVGKNDVESKLAALLVSDFSVVDSNRLATLCEVTQCVSDARHRRTGSCFTTSNVGLLLSFLTFVTRVYDEAKAL
jgi:hypothetical protein